jgi:hypothetical protein
MTTDCTRCGAATAAHLLTAINQMHREDRRNRKGAQLCPRCWDAWWEAETVAAQSLASHPGRPGPKPKEVA